MNRGVCASLSLFALSFFAPRAFAQSPSAAPSTIALGDWQLTPLVELRTRGEYWNSPVDVGGGQVGAPDITDAGGVLERARLGLGAERGPLKAQLTLQDARAWGSTPSAALLNQAGTAPASFGLFEGYAEAHTSSARPTYLRIGRQVVQWGEGRLLGAADWSPVGRSLDAARGHLAVGSAWDFELLAAILDSPRPLGNGVADIADAAGGVELYGASATLAIDPLLRIQIYGLGKVARAASAPAADPRAFVTAQANGETYTGALHVYGERDGWKYGAEGAYQLGRVPGLSAGGATDRHAYAAAASVTKTFEHVLFVPVFRLAGSYASGDDGHGTYKQFDPILPDVHTWYGAMDIFAWSNVIEGNLRATIAPTGDTTASLEYRYAQLAEAGGEWLNSYLSSVGRAPASGSQTLGHELDAWFTYSPWAPLELMAGYSLFIEGSGAHAILAAEGRGDLVNGAFVPPDLAHFAYLQATVRVP